MIAALGTLPFLATLWLLVVIGAAVLEESGAKIAAALRGEQLRRPRPRKTPPRMHIRWQSQAASRAPQRLRAAA